MVCGCVCVRAYACVRAIVPRTSRGPPHFKCSHLGSWVSSNQLLNNDGEIESDTVIVFNRNSMQWPCSGLEPRLHGLISSVTTLGHCSSHLINNTKIENYKTEILYSHAECSLLRFYCQAGSGVVLYCGICAWLHCHICCWLVYLQTSKGR